MRRLLLNAILFIIHKHHHVAHGNAIDYEDFASILSSEADIETNAIADGSTTEKVSVWWDNTIDFSWDEAYRLEDDVRNRRGLRGGEGEQIDATTPPRRRMKNKLAKGKNKARPKPPQTKEALYPFLVCDHSKGKSGYDRMKEVQQAASKWTVVLLNGSQRTCFLTGTTASIADYLDDNDFAVIPFTSSMKMRLGVLEEMHYLMDSQKELDVKLAVQVAPWTVLDDDSETLNDTAENILNDIKDMLNVRQNRNLEAGGQRKLSERFEVLAVRTQNADNRAQIWHRGLSDDNKCSNLFDSLSFELDEDDLVVTYIFDQEEVSIDCATSFLASLAVQKDVVSISLSTSVETMNVEAQWITQSGKEDERPWFDAGLTGKGQVVSVSDTGLDVDNCYFWDATGEVDKDTKKDNDFSRRKVVQYYAHENGKEADLGHGTHVSGTIVGHKADDGKKESVGFADGVAKGAKVAFFDMGNDQGTNLSLPNDMTKLFKPGIEGAGAMIHNGSWGRLVHYDVISKAFDRFAYQNEDFLAVVAAGNLGNDAEAIIEPANAKNVIAVGASQSHGKDLYWYDKGMDYVAYFSSVGPTEDDRIKPDIVAPGRTLLSAGARQNKVGECDDNERPKVGDTIKNNVGLSFSQGTSMASPVVAGTAALVRQYFQDGYYPSGKPNAPDAMTPTAALMKAVILNGGQPLTGIDNVSSTKPSSPYDSAQGFGRLSLIDSLPLSGANSLQAKIVDRTEIANDETHTVTVQIDKQNGCDISDLSATLVWTDPPAASGCQACLLNDLDLYIDHVGGGNAEKHYPNGHGGKDDLNNVERIRFEVDHGESFEISVYASNLSTASQSYSLVVTGCLSSGGSSSAAPTPTPTSSPTPLPTDPGTKSIETTYDSDDHDSGVMFDITATHTVTIESMDIHVSSTSNEEIEIFTKIGSHEGFESSPKRWSRIGVLEVKGKGTNHHTPIPRYSFSPIRIDENKMQAFYITLCHSDTMLYTKGRKVGDIFVSNSDLAIHEGTGVGYPFTSTTKKRVFNGVLNYIVDGEGSGSTPTHELETTFDQKP
eukprot:CAMPEP_0116003412 /NCGR_PEP_ID=MMETSP0321-20121206/41_1 /TAXON_ID=163516 /ORGANISM="Leptocylindrus danicus var. danicus, Strain B650" /LENGTH=1052 /DNA_ID=CAMNT_0003471617 /DNA_START=103 /DNA_END=3258 /DNA_ORIENTATION=-